MPNSGGDARTVRFRVWHVLCVCVLVCVWTESGGDRWKLFFVVCCCYFMFFIFFMFHVPNVCMLRKICTTIFIFYWPFFCSSFYLSFVIFLLLFCLFCFLVLLLIGFRFWTLLIGNNCFVCWWKDFEQKNYFENIFKIFLSKNKMQFMSVHAFPCIHHVFITHMHGSSIQNIQSMSQAIAAINNLNRFAFVLSRALTRYDKFQKNPQNFFYLKNFLLKNLK